MSNSQNESVRLLLGNNLETLKTLPDNSIDAVVTDPPYGLSFMGKKWDYDVPSIELWKEVFRVLKPGGHLLSFGGTRTYHRLVVAVEDAGFEIRDQIQWLYGSGFPKSMNIGKALTKQGHDGSEFEGLGTALKPANEPICVARKPLEKGMTVAQNVLKYGTGGLNIDGTRIGLDASVNLNAKQKNFDAMGYGGNQDTDGVPTYNPQGRWPANVILDEYAAQALDEQTQHLHGAGSARKGSDNPRIANHNPTSFSHERSTGMMHRFGDSGGASRFFYVAKASKRERNAGLEGMPLRKRSEANKMMGDAGPMKTGSGNERTTEFLNHHPTVKPVKLMEYLIKLVTPKGGTVLDPFMGSGTTGVAAAKNGVSFVGCELDPAYFEIAKKRIEHSKDNEVDTTQSDDEETSEEINEG